MTPFDRLCLGLLAAGRAFAEALQKDAEMPQEVKVAARAFIAATEEPAQAPQ